MNTFQLLAVLRPERVPLRHPVERVALERADHRSEVLAQRLWRRLGRGSRRRSRPTRRSGRARARASPCRGRRTRPAGGRRCTRRRARTASRGTCTTNCARHAAARRRAACPIHTSLLPRCRHTLWNARISPSMSRTTRSDVRAATRSLVNQLPVARQVVDPADVQPGPPEDGLALELEELRRHRVLERHGAGAELRVVLGPGALGRPGEAAHAGRLIDRCRVLIE